MFNDWCLVVTVQTTVDIPQLPEVPVESPQVQFLVKFGTPVLPLFFDTVVDVPVVLCNGVLLPLCVPRSPNVVSSAARRGDGLFASSTCHLNIITLVHVKILIVGNTGHLDNEID